MNRTRTGIPGLDKLLEGGFPEASTILLAGPPGTGKTIFGLQFLYNGIVDNGEPGVLIQLGEFPKSLYWYAEEFAWDFSELQKQKSLSIYSFDPKDYYSFAPKTLKSQVLDKLQKLIETLKVKRLVVDSITPLRPSISDEYEYETTLHYMINFFKEMNLTALLVADEEKRERYSTEAHIVDGVLHIDFEKNADEKQWDKKLRIEKMEATNFPMAWYPVNINTRVGISVRPFT
jgi:KaiC/GvpD/RAD55 family RecA-like ATPase